MGLIENWVLCRVHSPLQLAMSFGQSVGLSVGRSLTLSFFRVEWKDFFALLLLTKFLVNLFLSLVFTSFSPNRRLSESYLEILFATTFFYF